MSDDKKVFIEQVKRWVVLEKHVKTINEKLREIRAEKNEITVKICDYMDTHNLSQKQIALGDGAIRMIEKREYTPLSFAYIEECLETLISDKSQVDVIMNHLHENREIRVVNELKRTYAK